MSTAWKGLTSCSIPETLPGYQKANIGMKVQGSAGSTTVTVESARFCRQFRRCCAFLVWYRWVTERRRPADLRHALRTLMNDTLVYIMRKDSRAFFD